VSRKVLSLLLVFAVLALPVAAQAGVSSNFDATGKLNEIKFQNREVLLDSQGRWTSAPVQGGYLVSLFSATQIFTYPTPGNPNLAWDFGTTSDGYLLGYAVQKITGVAANLISYANTDYDPLSGKIASNNTETLVIYESPTNWSISSGNWLTDLTTSLASSTLWASFGIGAAPNNASFTPFPLGGGFLGLATYGLDVVQNPNGLIFDQSQALGNDIAGTATVWTTPPGYPTANNWSAFSNDPVSFALVPEPATLAMWGSFLAIGAAVALRRRQK
jgi:hypothetical protein